MTDQLAQDYSSAGTLIIKPSVANLKQIGEDMMDPYFKVILNTDKIARTPIAKGEGEHPTWSSELKLHRDSEPVLHLEVRDNNPDGNDELIGSMEVNIGSIIYNQNSFKCWVPMLYRGKERGEILVEFKFQPEQVAQFATDQVPNLDNYHAPGNEPDDDDTKGGPPHTPVDWKVATPSDPTTSQVQQQQVKEGQ